MGLELLADDEQGWLGLARNAVKSEADRLRRHAIGRRVRLYFDDYKQILRDHIYSIHQESPEVAAALEPFIPLVGGSSFLKRVADERARPLYARDPLRRIVRPGELLPPALANPPAPGARIELSPPSPDQQAWEGLAAEMDVNRALDQAARLITPSNKVFLYPRVIKSAEEGDAAALDLLTGDMVTVIPDPRRPSRPLALIYVLESRNGEPLRYACWDNRRYFAFDPAQGPAIDLRDHDFGLLPFVEVAQRCRPGSYWDLTSGADLEAQTLNSLSLDLVILYKAWTQRHIQLAFKGDVDGFPRNQVLNEKSILYIGGSSDSLLLPIDLQGDFQQLLNVQAANEARTAANWGISRDRLNQRGGAETDDGLHERVDELAQVMYRAELGLYSIAKAISREHPRYHLSPDSMTIVDLGYLHARTNRKTQLELNDMEVKQGLRSGVDTVLEDNPEYGGNRAVALAHIEERTREQAVIYEIQKITNSPKGNDLSQPGQTSADNGRMGPMVRDGKLSRDTAADLASGSLKNLARRILRDDANVNN